MAWQMWALLLASSSSLGRRMSFFLTRNTCFTQQPHLCLYIYPPLQGAQTLALKCNQALRFYQEQPLSPGRLLRLVTQSWQLAFYMLSTACAGGRAAVTSWWLRPLKDSPTPSQASLLLLSVPWEWWHTTGTACRIWMESGMMKPFPSPLLLKVSK